MKVFKETLTVETASLRQVVDLTGRLGELTRKSGLKNGVLLASSKHTTTVLTVSSKREGVPNEVLNCLATMLTEEKLKRSSVRVQRDPSIMFSYIQNMVCGNSIHIPVVNGKLDLGDWQAAYLIELAGPREREVSVIIIGE